MALLDAVLDVVRQDYAKTEPTWKTVSMAASDLTFLEKECRASSEFDPHGWRKEMVQNYKNGTVVAEVRECAYGRVVAMGEQEVLEGIPWGLWGRILRLYLGAQRAPKPLSVTKGAEHFTKAKVYFLANPYLRTIPVGASPHPSKRYPPIGPANINGGYTYSCNMETIVIYRAEDATRVLLHELQHASCLDHMEHGTDHVEAETEAWAELLYVGLLSQGNKTAFHRLVQRQANWMVSQNAEVKRHLRTEKQFPWRYTVGKQEVWERWGLIHSIRPVSTGGSLRLTAPPSGDSMIL